MQVEACKGEYEIMSSEDVSTSKCVICSFLSRKVVRSARQALQGGGATPEESTSAPSSCSSSRTLSGSKRVKKSKHLNKH